MIILNEISQVQKKQKKNETKHGEINHSIAPVLFGHNHTNIKNGLFRDFVFGVLKKGYSARGLIRWHTKNPHDQSCVLFFFYSNMEHFFVSFPSVVPHQEFKGRSSKKNQKIP